MMGNSRRRFLIGSAATATKCGTSFGRRTTMLGSNHSNLASDVIHLIEELPGIRAVKIYAPAKNRGREFVAAFNPQRRLFSARAFKGFILCEAPGD